MEWGSLLNKVGATVRSIEADVTKELGLRSGLRAGWDTSGGGATASQQPPDQEGWAEDDGWEDIDANAETQPDDDGFVDVGDAPAKPSAPQTPKEVGTEESAQVTDTEDVTPHERRQREEKAAVLADLRKRQLEIESRLSETRSRSETAQRKINALQREEVSLRRGRDATGKNAEMQEKDSRIAAVLAEGEQLQSKITAKKSECERMEREFQKLQDDQASLLDQLQALESKVEAATARVKQLEASEGAMLDAREAAENRLRTVGSESRTREGALAACEATNKELESLKTNQETALKDQQEAILLEIRNARSKLLVQAKDQETRLTKEISSDRVRLSQVMESAGWREDSLRKLLTELRGRCQQLETRNEELTAAVPEATRPLLRQLEQIQSDSAERSRKTSSMERNQMERLREAEQQNSVALEKQQTADARINSFISRNAALEQQLRIQSQDKSRLVSAKTRVADRLTALETHHAEAVEELTKQLAKVRVAIDSAEENAKQQVDATRENLSALERSVAEREQVLGSLKEKLGAIHEQVKAVGTRPADRARQGGHSSSSDGSRGAHTVEATEHLQEKYDSVANLHKQLAQREAAIQALADEVVENTRACEELEQEIENRPSLEASYEKLTEQHNALLALYGENEERIQEFEQDIQDVKAMYKDQMTELLMDLERAQSVG